MVCKRSGVRLRYSPLSIKLVKIASFIQLWLSLFIFCIADHWMNIMLVTRVISKIEYSDIRILAAGQQKKPVIGNLCTQRLLNQELRHLRESGRLRRKKAV